MTTENEQVKQDRDVSVLLELETYDGLTDGEVRSLIDWHVSVAVQSEESRAARAANAAAAQAVVEVEQQAYIESSAMLDRLLSGSLLLRSVESNE